MGHPRKIVRGPYKNKRYVTKSAILLPTAPEGGAGFTGNQCTLGEIGMANIGRVIRAHHEMKVNGRGSRTTKTMRNYYLRGSDKGEIRALIDTEASVSLIEEDWYKSLRLRGWLRRPDIEINQAEGKTMTIVEMVRFTVKI